MSYSNSFPTQRPTLSLDFANSGKLDSRLSYTRSSTGTFVSNEKALSSENLLLQSQNFGTSWNESPTVASRAASSGTGPDGSDSWLQTAATSGSSWSSFNQSFGFRASTQYTYSVHVKAGTATHAWFSARGDSSNYVTGTLDFSSPSSLATTSNGWTLNSSSVTALGSWYRISLTFTTNSTVSSPLVYVGLSDGTAPATYYPAGTPNGDTIYLWGAQLEERGSATAYNSTTTQIHREYSPLLKTASANEPRFEFASDGQSVAKGLLIEAQATNLTKYSDDFSSWGGLSTVAVTPNAGVAPSGQLAADLLVSPSTAAAHYILDSTIAFTSGTTYTASVYVKSAGHRYVQLCGNTSAFGASPYQYVNYDLEAGTLNANNCSGTISSVGNGYYRISATMTATVTSTQSFILMFADSLSAGFFPTTTGDDYSGFLAHGFQTEVGSAPSSLISTNGSQVSRASDSCSVALSNIGITSGQDLTAIVEGDAAEIVGASLLGFDDGSSSNYARISRHANNNYTFDARTNAVDQAGITLGSSSSATQFAFRLEQNNVGASADGSAVTTDTSATIGLMTTMQIGNAYWATQANGTISRVSIYSEPLSDANLTALTS